MYFNAVIPRLFCAAILGSVLAQPVDAESAPSLVSSRESKRHMFYSVCRLTQAVGPDFVLLSQPPALLSRANMDLGCSRGQSVKIWFLDPSVLPNMRSYRGPTFCTIIESDGKLVRACTKG